MLFQCGEDSAENWRLFTPKKSITHPSSICSFAGPKNNFWLPENLNGFNCTWHICTCIQPTQHKEVPDQSRGNAFLQKESPEVKKSGQFILLINFSFSVQRRRFHICILMIIGHALPSMTSWHPAFTNAMASACLSSFCVAQGNATSHFTDHGLPSWLYFALG